MTAVSTSEIPQSGSELSIPDTRKERIIIIGGGFAGLHLAKNLSKEKFQVVLLDKNNYHTFQPLLYQVATGGLEPDGIAHPFRKTLRTKSFFFRLATVEKILPDEHMLQTSEGKIKYDRLIIATGSKSNFFGNAHLEKFALGLKSIPEALDIRSWIFQNLEAAVMSKKNEAVLNIVIIGGGPTGVEVAGALADLRNHVLPKDYPELSFSKFKIIVVEGSRKILGAMSAHASSWAEKYLEQMGVELRRGQLVKDYDGSEVLLSDGEIIKTEIVIWSAGVMGNALPGVSQNSILKNQRYTVDAYNRVLSYSDIFAVGDVASMTGKNGKEYPMLAPVAIQQAKNLVSNLNRGEWKTFEYRNKGVLATVGRNKALADFGTVHLHGFIAWLIWVFVHLMTLVGFRNRIVVFMSWLMSYISFESAIRLIIRPLKKNAAIREEVTVPG
jgi:NADH dehydrogenase